MTLRPSTERLRDRLVHALPGRRAVRSHGPVRVMFVVPNLRFGGAERQLITLVPRMDPERFAPSVVCLHMAGEMYGDLSVTGADMQHLDRPARDPRLLTGLIRVMREKRPDIVIARGHSAEVLSRVAGVLAGVPRLAVWVHNCGEVGDRGRLPRVLDRVLEPVTASVYGVARGQIPYLTGERGHRPEKIQIVYNGVSLPEAPPEPRERDAEIAAELGIAPDEPVIGIVAVLRTEKDHAMLLRAFRRVLADVPRARLLIIGDGPQRDVVEGHVHDLDLTERVHFTGFRTDIPRVLTLLDVFTLSSRTVECFPMALLEAMRASVPAVCTKVGGLPEMIEEGVTGHIVDVGDDAALAAALTGLLRDPRRAREMGEAARRRLEKEFSLDRSVEAAHEAIATTAGR